MNYIAKLLLIIIAISFASVLVIPDCEAFTASHDVQFELHTRKNHSENFEVLVADHYGITVREPTQFDYQKPTRIYVHGYQSSRRSFLRYAKAFLKYSDCNFIAVNWLTGSVTKNYMTARGRVDRVGIALAELIDFLVNIHGMQLVDLMVVGHSLGAHISGVAGNKLKSGRIPVIVGLDPAYPLFTKKNTDSRLSVNDAEYVQAIHTNGGHLGLSYPVGHADFYPNWGRDQPGCSGFKTDFCSHARAHKLYIESLSPSSSFDSVQCASYQEIKQEQCTSSGPNVRMGGGDPDQMRLARGVYYTITRRESPYALNNTGEFDEAFNVS